VISNRVKGTLLILLSACGYASVTILGKWANLLEVPMFSMLCWRFAGAALLLWLLFQSRTQDPVEPKKRWTFFFMGIFGDAMQTTLFFLSIAMIGASLTGLLLYTFPFFVFLIERFVFRKPAARIQWLALLICFSGGVLVINPIGQIDTHPNYWVGVAYGLGAAIAYSCYISFNAHWSKNTPPTMAGAHLTLGACLSFGLISIFYEGFSLPASTEHWFICGGMILIGTVVPLLCLIKGMQLIGATQTSLILTIEPVITIVLAVILFEEGLTVSNVIGCVLILSAALLIQKFKVPVSGSAQNY